MNTNEKIEISETDAEDLISAIYDASGYDFSNYSEPSLLRRFQRFIDLKKIQDIPAFIHQLHHDSVLVNELIEEITVNVTEMFRDPGFFNILQKEVIPVLKELPLIKIWHAGCSTGEEPYSMAIVLKESGILDKSIIYATDINQSVLKQAATGSFSIDLLKPYEANYKEAGLKGKFSDYFEIKDGLIALDKELRQKIIFSTHNLVTDGVFNQFDIIICRNVLIYFNKNLQNEVLEKFCESLNNHGFMALGSKETIMFSPIEKIMHNYNSQFRIWRKMV
jgi:chemotaxis protein methyltransferase CheR